MPVNASNLLADLKRWVTRFENDLRDQCKEVPELDARLKEQYQLAKKAGRTAFAYSVWRDGELTQSAVGWVLSCVFVRFLEDNNLLERTYLSGVGENREVADQTRTEYFREHRADSDNDYLAYAVREVGKLPGMADLMDARHNALWNAGISPDAAKAFIEFWRRIDPGTGKMGHEFTDPDWDTRFLGDLYQDLSESARKKYALLQTPDFVEAFILDRTLDPAINTFGLKVVRMIDPTCGSGHFLLGGFRRLLALWEKAGTKMSERELVTKALDGVYGVDINPFAVAIARFRLLLEAWRYCGVKLLKSAPDFKVNLAVGDSLLHGARFDSKGQPYVIEHQTLFGGEEAAFKDELAHCFAVEDARELHRILGQQYHAVVGNPPYITVKDKALSTLYRERFDTCYRKYGLSVPFMERFFDLALSSTSQGAGFTGQITSNSFMKREMGSKLVEEKIPKWNLTHIIDSSGAFIPGHNGQRGGTPTCIVFGTNEKPRSGVIRAVMGIKSESELPDDPADGKVWNAITAQVDLPDSESEFVSSIDAEREKFQKHPWSLGGGQALITKSEVEKHITTRLGSLVESIGFSAIMGEDDAFIHTDSSLSRNRVEKNFRKWLIDGDQVRHWNLSASDQLIYPYDGDVSLVHLDRKVFELMWPCRLILESRLDFSKQTYKECDRTWWEFHQIPIDRNKAGFLITFADVCTHNNFVVVSPKELIFNRHSPIIHFKRKITREAAVHLSGLLNSALTCFWGRETFFPKGGYPEGRWQERLEWDGTKLKTFPISNSLPQLIPTEINRVAQSLARNSPEALTARDAISASLLTRTEIFESDRRASMISLQEELDWQCYRHYGLINLDDNLEWPEDRLDDLPGLTLGQRTFEIRMARQMESGDLETTWFKRHADAGSKAITELPDHWPDDYRALVERRLAFIEANKSINLIERPEYKRRWNIETWAERQQAALRKWLLIRLECYFHDSDTMTQEDEEPESKLGPATEPIESIRIPTRAERLAHIHPIRARFTGGTEPKLVSIRQLSHAAQADSQWMEAAAVYSGREDFEADQLVEKLVLDECVPFLPAQRYRAPGLRHRAVWEKTWDLQREEDKVEARIRKEHEGKSEKELKPLIRSGQQVEVGDIPVPPKYKSTDFQKTSYWKLRGKLDVPKERWVLYPGFEGGYDESPVIAWAGWDHAQQADALTGFYQHASDTWGWDTKRLAPVLAGLRELLPWLHQWHSEIDPEFNERPSATFQQFYSSECHTHRLTEEDIEVIRMGDTR